MTVGRGVALAFVAALAACGGAPSREPAAPVTSATSAAHPAHAHEAPTADAIDRALDEVARIHGAPGPWAVAGYRMAEHALEVLGLPRGSFDLEIVHESPREVQFSCIADGAAAYSGASLGKLNLSLVEVPEAALVTVYRNKKTGQSVALRPSASFRARYLNADRAKARALGREVMTLPDDQVFEMVPVPAANAPATEPTKPSNPYR